MVKPSIDELTQGKFNRYILVIAAAKSARYITNVAGAMGNENPDAVSDNGIVSKKESLENKSVKIAINKLNTGDIKLDEATLDRALNAGLHGIEGIN
jgi:DNA-directed RNA polymerase omega subunit